MYFVELVFLNNLEFSIESTFSLIFLNISIYIFLIFLIFGILFLFDLKIFKTLNEFKFLLSYNFITISLIFIIFSMAGVPPFMGFAGKFLMFLMFLFKKNFFVAFFFTFFNFFVIYFYTQNIRFLISKNFNNVFLIKNNFVYLNFNLIYFLCFFNFFNFFGLIFIEDFLIFFDFVSYFILI